MFLTIIIIILLIAIAAEAVLYRPVEQRLSRPGRTVYYVISATALLLKFVLMIIARATDCHTVWWTFLSTAASFAFLLNAVCKILFAAAFLIVRKSHKRSLYIVASVLFGLTVILTFYGLLWERNDLRTEHIEIEFDTLPAEADGMRIAQIGDIHIGLRLNRYRQLERIVEKVRAENPDLIVFCGDLIDSRYTELDSAAMAILSRMRAPKGVFSVTGNHDNGSYVNDTVSLPRAVNMRMLSERQRSMGWTVLSDSTAYVSTGFDSIAITGLDYPAELRHGSHGRRLVETDYSLIYDTIPDGMFNITVAHYPPAWDEVLRCGRADLTLAGHVHSMQIKIPVGKRGWSPAALVYKYWSGLYRRNGHYLYITDGAGSGIPVRIGVPPEITIITLRRK